jgi:hypothetical protein
MALPAHDGAFFVLAVAAFTVRMECFSQARCVVRAFFIMTLPTTLVFRGLIFQSLSVFINMMAFNAFFDQSHFVVLIMSKDSRGTLFIVKTLTIHHLHIFL